MEKISSAEIADIMLRQERFLTISEVTIIASSEHPRMLVTRDRVTNIIRHFVQSTFAFCEADRSVYPHRYYLHSLHGYQFKVRGRIPMYDRLMVKNSTKASMEQAECERRRLVCMANHIWNQSVANRRAGK
jgi:hypothetical protein